MKLTDAEIKKAVESALAEDVGSGDLTTGALVPEGAFCRAFIEAKEPGIIAGQQVARRVFLALDETVRYGIEKADGARAEAGGVIARLEGPLRAVLSGERAALNFLGRMSGIATLAGKYVKAVEGTGVKIMDTRKTAPGLRVLDKYAVTAGGGVSHRMGLYDAVLIKDNHIKALGMSPGELAAKARAKSAAGVRVEVEVSGIGELREALDGDPDIILLDNMGPREVGEAVEIIRARARPVLAEVSGGITLENVAAYAACGVDMISVGALTHSAPGLNLSLEVEA